VLCFLNLTCETLIAAFYRLSKSSRGYALFVAASAELLNALAGEMNPSAAAVHKYVFHIKQGRRIACSTG